jgi:hypothetical protein
MAHLLAKHALPRINLAFVIAAVWAVLAMAAAVYDIGHMLAAW